MSLYQVQAQVISIRGPLRCSVGAPTFYIDACSTDEAISKAHLVLACDHRDTDARQIELSGTVIRDGDRADYATFSYRPTAEGK